MTLGDRLKALRRELGLSQEALGAQGFVSTPGWIKIENGQRQPSEKMIEKLIEWLVKEKYIRISAVAALREELLILRYLGSHSAFVRQMARNQARGLADGAKAAILANEDSVHKAKSRRGRPVGTLNKKVS